MITYKIHLIRTGSTDSDMGKRFVGRLNLPLGQNGTAELAGLKERYAYPRADMLFTSPLLRCRQTAELLYPDAYTEALDGLADMDLGRFEGKTFDELRSDPNFSRWINDSNQYSPPDGESTADFTRRIVGALAEVFSRMMEQRMTSVVLITHGGVIMTLLAAIGLPKRPLHEWATPNGQGFTLLMTPGMWMRDSGAEVFALIPAEKAGRGNPDFD